MTLKPLRLFFLVIIVSHYAFSSDKLQVLSFNIGAMIPYSSSTFKRLNTFCLEVKDKSYDVILLQEVWIESYREYLKETCGYKYSLDLNVEQSFLKRFSKIDDGTFAAKLAYVVFKYFIPINLKIDSGLLILSKHPISNPVQLNFSATGDTSYILDGEFIASKGAIGAFITHPLKGEIFVANTHLIANYLDHNYDIQRELQLLELKTWFKFNSKSHPSFIGGDFNISPPQRKRNKLISTHNLWDVLNNAYFKNFNSFKMNYLEQTTFPGRNDNENEGVVDHIFGHNGLVPFEGYIYDYQSISDHNALFVSFNFKK